MISGYLSYKGHVEGASGETIGNIVSSTFLVVCLVLIPMLLIHILRMPLSVYQKEAFKNRWEVIHEDIRTDSKFASSYFIIFVARRVIFITISFFLVESPGMQRLVIFYMNLTVLLYTGSKPLVGRLLNRYEIANEIVVCLISWHLCFFSDWIDDEEAKVNYGWSLVVIIVVHMIFQLGTVMYFSFKLIKNILTKYFKRL